MYSERASNPGNLFQKIRDPQPHPHPGWHIVLQKEAPGCEATYLGTWGPDSSLSHSQRDKKKRTAEKTPSQQHETVGPGVPVRPVPRYMAPSQCFPSSGSQPPANQPHWKPVSKLSSCVKTPPGACLVGFVGVPRAGAVLRGKGYAGARSKGGYLEGPHPVGLEADVQVQGQSFWKQLGKASESERC